MAQDIDSTPRVILGKINGLYGIQGGVKIYSYTEPREQIFAYQPWQLKIAGAWVRKTSRRGLSRGKGLIALLEGVTDAETARSLLGLEIGVGREQLPSLAPGEYYWNDLMHLKVSDIRGNHLGLIVDMQETGANDVMVVQLGEQKILVPWVMNRVVKEVDVPGGRVVVDWDPEYQ